MPEILTIAAHAGVAQLVEQRIRNAKVVGSTPISGTNDLFKPYKYSASCTLPEEIATLSTTQGCTPAPLIRRFDCPNVARARGGCRTITAAGVPPLLAKDDFPTGYL